MSRQLDSGNMLDSSTLGMVKMHIAIHPTPCLFFVWYYLKHLAPFLSFSI